MTLYEDTTSEVKIWTKHFTEMNDNKTEESTEGFYAVKEEVNPPPSEDTEVYKELKLETPLEQSIEIAKEEEGMKSKHRKRKSNKKCKSTKGKKSLKRCSTSKKKKSPKKKTGSKVKSFHAW